MKLYRAYYTMIGRSHLSTGIIGINNKDIPVKGVLVKPLTDDGQRTTVLTTHINKVTHIIKMIQIDNTHHKPSNFSIIRTKS